MLKFLQKLKIKKLAGTSILLLLGLLTSHTSAGWLELPEQIDAKGVLEQYIISNAPGNSTNYTGNLINLGKLFKDGKIYAGIKDGFINTTLANINALLSSKFGITYGRGKFNLTNADKKVLSNLGILPQVENFTILEFSPDVLKQMGILNTTESYNYFKNTIWPTIRDSWGLKNLKLKSSKIPTNLYINGYPAILVPKDSNTLLLMFKRLFKQSNPQLDNLVTMEVPIGNKQSAILIIGLPNNPMDVDSTSIISSLAMEKAENTYLIQGKIKYPKELQSCFSGLNADTITSLAQLSSYMQSNCTALLSVDLDCQGQKEFIGNLNQGDPNQYTVVYGLDEKDGLFYVVPVHRFFQKRLVALLPSSIYNSSNNCGYNLLFQDLLSKKIEGNYDNTQGTHRLVWSSRNQGWPTSCSKWTDNSGIFKGTADTTDFADACDVASLPTDFLNAGNDLVVNYGVYMTGDTDNMQLYYGLKDSSDNIQNMYEIGKYLGFDTVGSGLVTKDLNIGFNNGVWNNGVFIPRYWQVNTQLFIDSSGYKATMQNIENKSIYNIEIKGPDNSSIVSSIVGSQYFKKIFNNSSYGPGNLNRYKKVFIFGSGTNSSNEIDLNYLDIGFNDYTQYLLYGIKTLADGTQKIDLIQGLDLNGFNIFFKDIGLDNYDNGDNVKGEFTTFSGQREFFTFTPRTQTGPNIQINNAIDIDALRVEFGGDTVGAYKRITHLKLVYDPTQNMYIVKQADAGPLSQTFIQGIQLGGILGDILKDCSLTNFINNDLQDCSHNQLQPLNVDNDKENIGNGFIDWPEWVYTSGSELRIFNNIVKKDAFGNYTVHMNEIFYSNNMTFCKKESQTIDYYKGHNTEGTALEIVEGNTKYYGYSPDEDNGVALVFKQGDYKFVFDIDDSDGKNFFNKTYILNQVIYDPNGDIQCTQ